MDAVKTLLIVIPLGLILAMGTAQAQPTQFQSGTSLTAAELADEEGRGFRRISPTELELTSGRGFGTDLDYRQLSDIVGRGFISQLSPNEIRQINARGLLPSPQQIELMTMNLVQATIKGITIVIDKSKFTSAELTVFLEEWEKYLSSL